MGLLALIALFVLAGNRNGGPAHAGVAGIKLQPVDEPAADPVVKDGPTSEPRGTIAEANGNSYVSDGNFWRRARRGDGCNGLLNGFALTNAQGESIVCRYYPADGYAPATFIWSGVE